jgi:hypothetical protein
MRGYPFVGKKNKKKQKQKTKAKAKSHWGHSVVRGNEIGPKALERKMMRSIVSNERSCGVLGR